jgi:hypothetical protein
MKNKNKYSAIFALCCMLSCGVNGTASSSYLPAGLERSSEKSSHSLENVNQVFEPHFLRQYKEFITSRINLQDLLKLIEKIMNSDTTQQERKAALNLLKTSTVEQIKSCRSMSQVSSDFNQEFKFKPNDSRNPSTYRLTDYFSERLSRILSTEVSSDETELNKILEQINFYKRNLEQVNFY